MQGDVQALEQFNIQIEVAESKGDDESRNWLDGILARQLAFRHAERVTFDNRG